MDTLLRRRKMMGVGSSSLEFYSYLYFDGTAYIDTDIVPPTDFSVRVNMGKETLKSAQRIFLCSATTNSIGVIMGAATSSTTRSFGVYYGSSSAAATMTIDFSAETYTMFLTPYKFGAGNVFGAITKGAGTPNGPMIIGYNVNKSGQPYTGRMSYFRIYDADAKDATSAADLLNNYTPLYTLKPCKYNGVDGLWCEELSKFYGNSASGGTLTASNS